MSTTHPRRANPGNRARRRLFTSTLGSPFRVLVLTCITAACLQACGDQEQPEPQSGSHTVVPSAVGGFARLDDGTVFSVPPGATEADLTVALSRTGTAPKVPDYLSSLGEPVHIELDPALLVKPATLEIPFNQDRLPDDTSAEDVFVAYYDETRSIWIPVEGTVDVARGVIVAETIHASWWNPFSWDWDAWIASLTKVLELRLKSLVDGVVRLTESCEETASHVSLTQSTTRVIKACVEADIRESPRLRVVNLKSFHIGISASGGGAAAIATQILAPGASRAFSIDPYAAPPLVIRAEFTPEAMHAFVAHLAISMLPAAELIPADATQAIGRQMADAGKLAAILEALNDRDALKVGEEIARAFADEGFINAFVAAAVDYGKANRIESLKRLSAVGVKQLFIAVSATNVILKSGDFLANYFFNNSTALTIRWSQQSNQARIDQFLASRGLTGRIVGRADVTGDGRHETFVHATGPALPMRSGIWFVFEGADVIFERGSGATGPLMEIPGTCEPNSACVVAPSYPRPAGFRAIRGLADFGGNCCPWLYEADFMAWDGTKFFTAARQRCLASVVREGPPRSGSGGPNCPPPAWYSTPEEAVRASFPDALTIAYSQERAGTVVYTVAGQGGEPGDVFLRRTSAGWAVVSSGCGFGFQDCWELVPE